MAPTGSGKTLAAFLFALDRLMFGPKASNAGVRVLYISPIKALTVDVERNLRAPLTGLLAVAQRLGQTARPLSAGIRNGDTPQSERARMLRKPPDILITTPESFYLMLTSKAAEVLRSIDVVILDEIHAMVPSKRGTHLALSLERLEAIRTSSKPLQRIGLSATQRPLEEVARFLGGYHVTEHDTHARPVTIVDAGEKKTLKLRVEVPTEDMVGFSDLDDLTVDGQLAIEGVGSDGRVRSIWPAVYPKLVAHIRAHRSTLIFVNARRSAERLANALNEVAGEEIARAHHGSLATRVRADIEDLLKQGKLPAIVATASLELGIDMGAIDLVVQVEAPPSIASGLQRIGRASHFVGGIPEGITYPKFRSDLVACAAAGRAMLEGHIEATQFPRNPLDVLAQQLVAIVGMDDQTHAGLHRLVRAAAPFHDLSVSLFDAVLDMLSGRYPSDDFSELRPRLTWDRLTGDLTARKGAKRLAVINGGTIPERGLYGVFLAGAEGERSRRVGELDEEMVFESRVGEVFLLGASSWRVEEITHDRVLVSPAPGEAGKMPFWHGDRPGRPLEFGRAIGAFLRTFGAMPRSEAYAKLQSDYTLDHNAATNLLNYLEEQQESGGIPTDEHIIIERFIDEIGDWRICVLSPFGAQVHAPWAMAVRADLLEEYAFELDVVWSDDGIVFRLPEGDAPPDDARFFPDAADVEERIIQRLADTSLFAARFRENAGRSLLLPKRRPGSRSPLWALRRRAASLLSVASRFRDFPIVLETYRECLQDQFDVPGLQSVLRDIAQRRIRVSVHEVDTPSPFAAALMFQYVANFMYEGDAPLAERRAHALTVDHVRLRELLGDAALRELLDPEAIAHIERQLQQRDRVLTAADDVHDLLLSLGPLTRAELESRAETPASLHAWIDTLIRHRRIVDVRIAGRPTLAAAEDAARLRDGLGVVAPPGLPSAFLDPVEDPLGDLVMRFARNRGPFMAEALCTHYGLAPGMVQEVLRRFERSDRLVSGEFLPGGSTMEWCEAQVLRRIKRASLRRLREEVESVEHDVFARFCVEWHGLNRRRRGEDAMLDMVAQLQGSPLPATVFESDIFNARIEDYHPADLDTLMASGELLWRGIRATGHNDGRIALYTTSHLPLLATARPALEAPHYEDIRSTLASSGAVFFKDLHAQIGGLASALLERLWDLVWNGEVSNDSLTALRNTTRSNDKTRRREQRHRGRRTQRRETPRGAEGRWWLVEPRLPPQAPDTDQRMAIAQQLLERHGILTREAIATESLPGGFSYVYPVLKALEEAGKVRRGYFVEGLGATQFAVPGAEDLLRAKRTTDDTPQVHCLATTDPANPYGSALPWPEGFSQRPQRAPGARVVLYDGRPIAYLSRSGKTLSTRLNEDPVSRRRELHALAKVFKTFITEREQNAVLFETIDGAPAAQWPHLDAMRDAGFRETASGLMLRRHDVEKSVHA